MKQWGIVIEVGSEKALVEVCSQSGCKNCGRCLGATRSHRVWAANPIAAQVGERVCLHLSTKLALAGGFLLYILPLLLMLTGYGLCRGLFQGSELVGAILGLVFALWLGSVTNRQLERRGALELTIVEVVRNKS